MIAAIVLIVAGVVGGYFLSLRFHDQSRTLESIARIPFNLLWILAGVFSIVGGYYVTGVAILALWSYFLFSNTRRVRNGDLNASPGGWRRRVANWTPYNRSK
ncbi:hypothetical protein CHINAEXTREME_20500 (plasmid) [Halobiforma lacisalsi AJ5]|uniref:Uncharacterized protein n=1 Tax=Natronobacterium lacisalsi AJ5 TaxID=358396 RepID=M0LW55_NATLA|nr:hypothetical protein [Halobiforma lacisalsi]APX00195.1 hypothetical protein CHINAEXTREME_20500 [Halobiforma lacisalsi AJ5]EMA37388.1 hypothetical protein C445_00826 [Halobiforma lacisalsi AJ5]